MGSLVQNTSVSEITALLERLAYLGVTHEEFDNFRRAPLSTQIGVVNIFKYGREALPNHRQIIDCDAAPQCPKDWKVVKHVKGGQWEWDALDSVRLIRTKSQPTTHEEQYIYGDQVQKELKGVPVLNASVMWYLFEHQWLIPITWKDCMVHFWGTLYQDPRCPEDLRVYHLQYFPGNGQGKGNWRAESDLVKGGIWQDHDFAAIRRE